MLSLSAQEQGKDIHCHHFHLTLSWSFQLIPEGKQTKQKQVSIKTGKEEMSLFVDMIIYRENPKETLLSSR